MDSLFHLLVAVAATFMGEVEWREIGHPDDSSLRDMGNDFAKRTWKRHFVLWLSVSCYVVTDGGSSMRWANEGTKRVYK